MVGRGRSNVDRSRGLQAELAGRALRGGLSWSALAYVVVPPTAVPALQHVVETLGVTCLQFHDYHGAPPDVSQQPSTCAALTSRLPPTVLLTSGVHRLHTRVCCAGAVQGHPAAHPHHPFPVAPPCRHPEPYAPAAPDPRALPADGPQLRLPEPVAPGRHGEEGT